MMAVRPFKTLLSVSTTFKTLDADTGAASAFGQKGCCSIALVTFAFKQVKFFIYTHFMQRILT